MQIVSLNIVDLPTDRPFASVQLPLSASSVVRSLWPKWPRESRGMVFDGEERFFGQTQPGLPPKVAEANTTKPKLGFSIGFKLHGGGAIFSRRTSITIGRLDPPPPFRGTEVEVARQSARAPQRLVGFAPTDKLRAARSGRADICSKKLGPPSFQIRKNKNC